MKDNANVLEADLNYAERMVRTGYASPEKAAQACGVPLADLQSRLAGGATKVVSTTRADLFRSFDR